MSHAFDRLLAVNMVMRQGLGIAQVSALDSTGSWPTKVYGTSEHGFAEKLLDQATRAFLTHHIGGFNTLLWQSATPSGSPLGITLPSNAIRVVGDGFFKHWNFDVVAGKLAFQGSTTLPALNMPYLYHVFIDVDFDSAPADVQAQIVEQAIRQAQLIKNRDPVVDQMLAGREAVQTAKPKGASPSAFDGHPLMQSSSAVAPGVRMGQ